MGQQSKFTKLNQDNQDMLERNSLSHETYKHIIYKSNVSQSNIYNPSDDMIM